MVGHGAEAFVSFLSWTHFHERSIEELYSCHPSSGNGRRLYERGSVEDERMMDG